MFDSLLNNPATALFLKVALAIAIVVCIFQFISRFKVWLYCREVIAEVKRSLAEGDSAEEIHRKCHETTTTRMKFMVESAKDGRYSAVDFILDHKLIALMIEDYDVLDDEAFVERYS